MSKWKIWVAVAVVFFAGVVVGASGTICYIHNHLRSMVAEGPSAFNRMIADHIGKTLDLTVEQEAEVLEIVEATHEELWRFKLQHEDHINAIIQGGIDRMKVHLDAEQKQELDELFRDLHDHLRSHLGDGRHTEAE